MIIDYIRAKLRMMTPIEMAKRELLEAQRNLLEAESAFEYAHCVATYDRARIARLRAYLARESAE